MTVELRDDGIYLLYPRGEEVGPFANSEAGEFLKYLDKLQGGK